jgi:hypothetical protein
VGTPRGEHGHGQRVATAARDRAVSLIGMHSRRIRTPFLIGAAVAIAAVALAGCTGERPEAEPVVTRTPAPTPTPTPDPVELAPLTGREVEPGSLARPSIAAKIDNHPAARPQVGLNSTDIVFEELVEGGLTRYVAVWQSNVPAEIGPVRSIRPMDPDIVSPFGGIIAYSGGQQHFVDMMRGTGVFNAIHGAADTAQTFYRTSSKSAPHNVIVKAPEVIGQHGDLAAPPEQFSYSTGVADSTAVRQGGALNGIALRFGSSSSPSWTWSGERWQRAQAGVPDLDEQGAQLQADNVVTVQVPITMGFGVPKTELIGSGRAWVASGGRMLEGTWSKESQTAPIRVVDAAGEVVRLAPGNTWVELLPDSGTIAAQ